MLLIVLVIALVTLSKTVQGHGVSRNPCRNFKCLNGGTCTSPLDVPSCQCRPGFFGPKCEYNRDPCFNFVCLNGGRCTAPADAPFCQCPAGFTGNKCQIKVVQSGSCPKIYPPSSGVCGGVFCSSDYECSPKQKCCASACGGNLCTNVTTEPDVDLVSICSLIDCMPNRICRVVVNCVNCQPKAECVLISQLGEDVDKQCRKQSFLQAVLVKDPNYPSNIRPIRCSGSGSKSPCPAGSVCVKDDHGNGQCCFGKSIEKEGSCPAITNDTVGVCGGIFCDVDVDCPDDQKCCHSPCGSKLCTNPVPDMSLCPNGCPPGHTCEFRPIVCPPGLFCPQALVPTCVPPITDACGGCPNGQVCQPTGIVCVRAPCPSHKCVPVNPPEACNMFCKSGFRCVVKPRECPAGTSYCSTIPVAQCIPIELASCPKPSQETTPSTCPVTKECEDDSDCNINLFERCCPNRCNVRVCTKVPVFGG